MGGMCLAQLAALDLLPQAWQVHCEDLFASGKTHMVMIQLLVNFAHCFWHYFDFIDFGCLHAIIILASCHCLYDSRWRWDRSIRVCSTCQFSRAAAAPRRTCTHWASFWASFGLTNVEGCLIFHRFLIQIVAFLCQLSVIVQSLLVQIPTGVVD